MSKYKCWACHGEGKCFWPNEAMGRVSHDLEGGEHYTCNTCGGTGDAPTVKGWGGRDCEVIMVAGEVRTRSKRQVERVLILDPAPDGARRMWVDIVDRKEIKRDGVRWAGCPYEADES